MKTLKVWDVQFWDGGDRHNHAFFLDRSTPVIDIERMHEHSISLQHDFIVLDSLDEYPNLVAVRKRTAALAKLTPEERVLLGLEKP